MSEHNGGAGHETVVIIDEGLHEESCQISKSHPTGGDIVQAAQKEPIDGFFVLYSPDNGGLRELRQSDEIDLLQTKVRRFYVVPGDRLFRFQVDGVEYEWPISPVSGALLYHVANLDAEKVALWTQGQATDREISSDEASVDLAGTGVEHFVSKSRGPKHPTIFINDVAHTVQQPHLSGAQLRALGGIESDYQLFLEQPGDDLPISNDKSVKIDDGQRFYSLPPATFGT
ncbi:multiubiquitin domain-containing protein [Bradyrhizobium sp. 151]|uniref:multiubiquitin domain-containing protein n=1 Tax=Bradyrhizobium sp. 151 TaxID=2782626 RepID=UPI001FFBA86A|nr:multiubiquitin domain-containing protein [Bradyrhizobium sp. 151]MCK1656653.1 multiubiquitin domain-containing protein [Bradyrhizobium sp. 151]